MAGAEVAALVKRVAGMTVVCLGLSLGGLTIGAYMGGASESSPGAQPQQMVSDFDACMAPVPGDPSATVLSSATFVRTCGF